MINHAIVIKCGVPSKAGTCQKISILTEIKKIICAMHRMEIFMPAIKGVSKKIIEINEFEHEFIEKVYVVLKAKSPQVKISKQKSEAENYVSNLICYKRNILPFSKKTRYFVYSCIAACAIATILIIAIQ